MATLGPIALVTVLALAVCAPGCVKRQRWVRSGQVVPADSFEGKRMRTDFRADFSRCKLEAKLARLSSPAKRHEAIHDCLLKKGWRKDPDGE